MLGGSSSAEAHNTPLWLTGYGQQITQWCYSFQLTWPICTKQV